MVTTYPKFVDLFGWITVCLAVAVAVASVAGVVSVLHASSRTALGHADYQLHEVHYVIQPHWTAVTPFVLCLLLAFGIGYFGYSVTKRSVERRISKAELGGPTNGSQPGQLNENSTPPSAGSRR